MKSLPFKLPQTMYSGLEAMSYLVAEVKKQKAERALVVTDKGLVEAGIIKEILDILEKNHVTTDVFDETEPEPTTTNLKQAIEYARKCECHLVLGVGGGSSMDTAKACAALHNAPSPAEDYLGVGLIPEPGIPCILIPTTSGSGSEVSPNAIFKDTHNNIKTGMVSEYLIPAAAIVDPALTLTLPPDITAATGMDALTHAIEAYTSTKATLHTDLFALEAIRLISKSLRRAVALGSDINGRLNMSLGSFYAAIAFSNAGVGAVHALAYPLGGKFHITHGISNSMLLPHVMEFNIIGDLQKFSCVARAMGVKKQNVSDRELAYLGLQAVKELSLDVGIPQKLGDVGVDKEEIKNMAKSAVKAIRLMDNNPRVMSWQEAAGIYKNAY